MKKNWKTVVVFIALVVAAFGIGRWTGGDDGEPDDDETAAASADEDDGGAEVWTCPMHPQIEQDEFGTCPICHMDLVEKDDADSGDDEVPAVRLSDGARNMARVQNAHVEAGAVTGELDVFGRVDVDEEAEVDLAAWTGGRIERLLVNATGENVARGELLAQVYSPELLSAQRTLLQALENKKNAEESESDRRARAARASLDAARTELRLLGVDRRQIDQIEETGQARETVDIYATASGTVRTRHVTEGDYVSTGDKILSLAPLDTVWAQLEIYERDLRRVEVGTPVTVEVPALDGEQLEGRITFISPEIDDRRRVARARVVLSNEDGDLRPGMYLRAGVEIAEEGDDVLSVPKSAVLWTGKRSLVYRYDRQLDPPGYVAQPVELGPRIGDRYVIREGLSEGDEVASRGAFRIDAELQIRGGPTMMSAMHDEGVMPLSDEEIVEVPDEGAEFDPPIDPEQLPDGVWFCDMGTAHWAQPEKGDDECPLCGMRLTEKVGDDGDDHEEHDHDHDHDHGGHHVH